jgi:hypothetical protein
MDVPPGILLSSCAMEHIGWDVPEGLFLLVSSCLILAAAATLVVTLAVAVCVVVVVVVVVVIVIVVVVGVVVTVAPRAHTNPQCADDY